MNWTCVNGVEHAEDEGCSTVMCAQLKEARQQIAQMTQDRDTFTEQLRDALGAPADRTWFNTGLLEVARTKVQQLAEARAQGMRDERLRCENIVITERLRHGGIIALDACDRILEAIGVIELAERAAEAQKGKPEALGGKP